MNSISCYFQHVSLPPENNFFLPIVIKSNIYIHNKTSLRLLWPNRYNAFALKLMQAQKYL